MADKKPVNKTGLVSKDNTDPLVKLEKQVVIYYRKGSNTLLYENFDREFKTYLLKLPNSNCKKVVTRLINDKYVYIVSNINNSKNGVFGIVIVTPSNKIGGVGVESNNMNIDIRTGETPDIDNCIFDSYQQHIRAGVYSQHKAIKNDWDLHRLVLKYLYYVYLKIIGSRNIFSDKQKDLLRLALYYFYIRFALFKDHNLALEKAYKLTKLEDLYKEFKTEFDLFKKYDNFADIFKAVKDLKIVGNSTVSSLILNAIKLYTIGGYYAISSTLDMFVSTAVVSLYPVRYITNLQVNPQLQKEIENKMLSYCKKIKWEKFIG